MCCAVGPFATVLLELWLVATTADRTRTRLVALNWIGKHLGMFTNSMRVTGELPVIKIILDDGQDEAKRPVWVGRSERWRSCASVV